MWSEERVAYAQERWLQGDTAAAIAKELGGVTRNAVIGKLHRSGLFKDEPRQERQRAPKPRRRALNCNAIKGARIAARVKTVQAIAIPVPPLNVPFLDRAPGQCRAITDATRYAQKVCGHPTADGERDRYCAWHVALHYQSGKGRSA